MFGTIKDELWSEDMECQIKTVGHENAVLGRPVDRKPGCEFDDPKLEINNPNLQFNGLVPPQYDDLWKMDLKNKKSRIEMHNKTK